MSKNEKKFFIVIGIIILIIAILLTVNKNSKIIYTVSFNTNGGTAVRNQKIEEYKTAEKPIDPTKEGYEFLGWYLEDEPFDFLTAITGNINLEAKWEESIEDEEQTIYKITLDDDGETSIVETDENGLLKEPENLSKEGYEFLGWYIGDNKVDFSKPFESDVTIVAKWEEKEEEVNNASDNIGSSTNPTYATKPTQTNKPTESNETTNSTESDEPTIPTEPDEPTTPTEPDEPTTPTEPDEPTTSTEPDEPTTSTESDESTETIE